jgi:hypothetical protein
MCISVYEIDGMTLLQLQCSFKRWGILCCIHTDTELGLSFQICLKCGEILPLIDVMYHDSFYLYV